MPVVIRLFGYKIYFWVNEGKPLEPIHVHVAQTPRQNATKIWLLESGDTKVENNNSGIPNKDLMRICATIRAYRKEIEAAWKNTFGELKYYDRGKEHATTR